MKSIKKRAMKKSAATYKTKKGAFRAVFAGKITRSKGGVKKEGLMKTKSGKIVSKKAYAAGKKAYKRISGWVSAVAKAKKALGLKGFVAPKKGSALYKKAKSFYK